MLNELTEGIYKALQKLKGKQHLTDITVNNVIKEIQRALIIQAGVNYKIAKRVTDEIKEDARGLKFVNSIDPRQVLVKIIHEKFTELMGDETKEINLEGNPTIVLLVGLQGAGKTRFAGKLAGHLQEQHDKRVLLVACDVSDPTARKQLQEIGAWVETKIYAESENNKPLEIAQNALKYAKENHYEVVIIDTEGSIAVNEVMIEQVISLREAIQPTETLFVADTTTEQEAINTTQAFQEQIGFDGIVLTKLDLDTKGGVILSIRDVVDKPIKYISTGEKMTDVRLFDPGNMASRILDLGDFQKQVLICGDPSIDEIDIIRNNIYRRPQFDYEHFLACLKPSSDSKIPYMSKVLEKMAISDEEIKRMEAMIGSMTYDERHNPVLMREPRRRKRIARGSGTSMQQVHHMTKQLGEMRNLIRKMTRRSKNRRYDINPFE